MKLFDSKKGCCGCSACQSVCPKSAIKMSFDEYGCAYPEIDRNRCVDCGACERVCPVQHHDKTAAPIKAYAAADNTDAILKSASGGVFASLGGEAVKNGCAVFGCAWSSGADTLTPKMIKAETPDRLRALQGSKYVQAEADDFYGEIKRELKDGREVVFSGTPCQVSALKNYLAKPCENLYTIDIICHGVPGTEFFRDFIRYYEAEHKQRVKSIRFRDKIHSWGLNGSISFLKRNAVNKKIMYEKECSYYSYFLRSFTYRESCYSCPYACEKRPGDLTIGDYWGIEDEHPELLKPGALNIKNGVSCVMVNTAKGAGLLSRFGKNLSLFPTEFNKISAHNDQLVSPSKKPDGRERIMESYKQSGYKGVEDCFSREKTLKWHGDWIKRRIKKLIRKT